MKIAIDYQSFTMQSYGGISRYYTKLADNLFKEEQDVRIFAGIHRNNYVSDLPKKILSGAKIDCYPKRTAPFFNVFNHTYSQIKSTLFNPDIIHESYYSSLPLLKSDSIRVTTAYDMIHELFKYEFHPNDKTTLNKKVTFDRVDHILSISQSTKKDMIEILGIDESKISVVHLGVDLERFDNINKERVITEQYIIYVGAREGYKNFSSLVKACANSTLIKNKIKIIAFGGGKFTKKETCLIHDLGFKENEVIQIGGSDEDLINLYSNALCFVYPSIYEGFGLPPLEAMASGCPVVSSNTSSMPEVVRDAGIYFDPLDIDSLRSAVEMLIDNESLREKLIQKGYKNADSFTWKKCANKTLSIYRDLL